MTDQTLQTEPESSGCCPSATVSSAACGSKTSSCGPAPGRTDWMLWGSAIVIAAGYMWHFVAGGHHTTLGHLSSGVVELMNLMWVGIAIGIVAVGLLDRVPRDLVIAALAGERRTTGILRATAAGVLFDLCSHGILMVGMKLYERGATIGQTIAFLLASPWNSLSLTVILIALVGWWYTLLFILLSMLIAVITGLIFDALVERGSLPDNPARAGDTPPLGEAWRTWRNDMRFSFAAIPGILMTGLKGSRTVLRWLLFGVVLAAAIRAFVPLEIFEAYFGPTMLGLFFTVLAATIIEVCSEGSTPIAADLVTRAGAPGNGFTFLMAGVATDYTEVMTLKDTTASWKLALTLPLIAVPQTLIIGFMLNTL